MFSGWFISSAHVLVPGSSWSDGDIPLANSATGFHVDENVGNPFMTGDAGQ
jgi:hypothetical protein